MSLILDRREAVNRDGSQSELLKHLKRYDIDITSDLELPFGDLMFEGQGEDGECLVGVERKRLSDLINSMKDRRLSGHQLRGLWQSYDYVFLIVEGVWRPGSGGTVEELCGREFRPVFSSRDRYSVNYRQLTAFLNSLSLRSRHPITREPLRVIRTSNPAHTAAEYMALYCGFTEKTWEEHHAHDQIYTEFTPPQRRVGIGPRRRVTLNFKGEQRVVDEITPAWKMLAQIDGIDRKAEGVSAYFRHSMRDAVLAGLSIKLRRQVEEYFERNPRAAVKEWMEVEGIGKKTAETAVRTLAERTGERMEE